MKHKKNALLLNNSSSSSKVSEYSKVVNIILSVLTNKYFRKIGLIKKIFDRGDLWVPSRYIFLVLHKKSSLLF